jgi:nucleoid DNA-binding protein
METVTKADLSRLLTNDLGLKKSLAKQLVDSFFDALTASILEGDRIEARGFGVWEVKKTNPKPKARNPRTGEIVYVPARRKVSFKPGRLIKEALAKPIDTGEPSGTTGGDLPERAPGSSAGPETTDV